jgi:hypothetical protein
MSVFQCLKLRATVVQLLFFVKSILNVRVVILGVTVLMESLQMSLIFHSAVRLCPMLLNPMVLFQMVCGLCLSFKHLAYFWPSAVFIDETENHRPSVSKVPVLLVRMWIRLQ